MVTIDPALVRWSVDEPDRAGRPLVVLLHGVGSHEGDLIALAPYLPQNVVLASLRAPLPHGDGFSWYPLSTPGAPSAGAVDDAAEAVLTWLDGLGDEHPTVGLIGFSQGGSLSLQLLRHAPRRFAFTAVIAGFVVPAPAPVGGADEAHGSGRSDVSDESGAPDDAAAAQAAARDEVLAEVRPPVFYGRGDVDQVIPSAAVERTSAWLEQHADAEQTVYPGLGHGVSQEELDDLVAFMSRVANPVVLDDADGASLA